MKYCSIHALPPPIKGMILIYILSVFLYILFVKLILTLQKEGVNKKQADAPELHEMTDWGIWSMR